MYGSRIQILICFHLFILKNEIFTIKLPDKKHNIEEVTLFPKHE
jgi:hypothetical protein